MRQAPFAKGTAADTPPADAPGKDHLYRLAVLAFTVEAGRQAEFGNGASQ